MEPGANRLAIGNNSAPRFTVDGQLQRRIIHVTTLWWPASFPVHHKPGAICFFKDCIHTSVKNLPTGVKTKWRLHCKGCAIRDRKSTRLNSSHVAISYAVFCLKKKNEESANERDVRQVQ